MAAQREVNIHIIFCAVTIFLVTVFFQTNCIGEESFKKPLYNSLQSFSLTLKCCKSQFRLSLRNDVRTCTLIYLLLIQAGDIEINPGPRYPCGICKKNVNWNSKSIQCDGCDVWYHAACAKIGPETFRNLEHSSVSWICIHCGLPNVSSQHCIDIDELFSSNTFSPLAQPDSAINRDHTSPTEHRKLDFSSTPKRSTPTRGLIPDISRISMETQSSHANSIESELTSSYLGESHMNTTNRTSNYMSDTSPTKPKKENLDILVINF